MMKIILKRFISTGIAFSYLMTTQNLIEHYFGDAVFLFLLGGLLVNICILFYIEKSVYLRLSPDESWLHDSSYSYEKIAFFDIVGCLGGVIVGIMIGMIPLYLINT